MLVAPLLAGETDVVGGSRRWNSGRPRITVLANRALTSLTNVLFARPSHGDLLQGDARPRARSLGLTADRFDIEPEITARLLKRTPSSSGR